MAQRDTAGIAVVVVGYNAGTPEAHQASTRVIDLVGGANIAKGQIENRGPLAPEYVLARQPEVVLLAGPERMSAPEAVRVGFRADAAAAQRKLSACPPRAGWADLPAAKSGESQRSITADRGHCRISSLAASRLSA